MQLNNSLKSTSWLARYERNCAWLHFPFKRKILVLVTSPSFVVTRLRLALLCREKGTGMPVY